MSNKTVSIRVVDENGRGVRSILITIHFSFTFLKAYTDSNGWSSFEMEQRSGTASGDIYVGGSAKGRHSLEDGKTLSFTL